MRFDSEICSRRLKSLVSSVPPCSKETEPPDSQDCCELLFSPAKFGISTCFVWSLSQVLRLLPTKQLAISLTVVGEEAAQELLFAYACGIRHFPGSILDRVELYRAKLPDIVLTAARLRAADICEADLEGADFHRADLTDASLIQSNLVRANFSGSNLTGAWLISADLSGADLRCACLHNADLTGADLVGANLTGANLEGAIFDEVRWQANESSGAGEKIDVCVS